MNQDELMYASKEDLAFFNKIIDGLSTHEGKNGDGLDDSGTPIPYSCGPHSLRSIRRIAEIAKPKNIFEIGFNLGFSSSMWLEICPKSKVFSCDISYKKETIDSIAFLSKKQPKRFSYLNRNAPEFNKTLKKRKFDLAFIDAGHLFDDVCNDIKYCLSLKIPFISFDDILPQYGEVQLAIDSFSNELEFIEANGNMAIYKNKTV